MSSTGRQTPDRDPDDGPQGPNPIPPSPDPVESEPGTPLNVPPLPLESTMGKTPHSSHLRRPDIDEYGLPLPRRVTERDLGATVVGPRAFRSGPSATPPPSPGPPAQERRRPPRGARGCLVRLAILALFLVTGLACAGVSYAGYAYYSIASVLPSVEDLAAHASQFETTRIYDRDGGLLYELVDPNAGRRTRVPLGKISPYLVAATIATEDREFYNHPGFDPIAIARALWQNAQEGETVSGASTITQQLTRALLFDPEERNQRSTRRKMREIILAAEITRRYTKDEILELYLNEIYYGNLAYGVEAAAETYFNTTADRLTLAQASFLAGLPQAPSVYDVYTHREATLGRQQTVLTLMTLAGCIEVSNSAQPICVTPEQAGAAAAETAGLTFTPPAGSYKYPHWVNHVRSVLEAQYGSQFIYRSGFNVYTTLSSGLQDLAQQTVADQVNSLADKHVTNGALVAIHPATGQILAMVGSKDFDDESISGQVNMATAPRQPGSSIKPLTYVAAFEKGWTPATLIWDVPSEYPPSGRADDYRDPYKPVNYDGKFHGPTLLRAALANSYNVPAVKALQFVGIHDDPTTETREGLIPFAQRLGVTTLTRDDYGLSLTLGGGEVPLLEMTGAYSVFANGGVRVPPVAILKITNFDGDTIYEYTPPPGEPVVRPEHAYLISHILSDNAARTPAFGPHSALLLSFPAAVKTGTTNDYRDNWTIGYTPDLAVGVWVGNADFTPMRGTSGLTGAAPIWHNFMEAAMPLIPNAPTPFTRPPGIVERSVCAVSGVEPSEWCPSPVTEVFAADQPPLPKEQDVWQRAYIDKWTGLRASAVCPSNYDEKVALNAGDPFARRWLAEDPAGQAWAQSIGFSPPLPFPPDGECRDDTPLPIVTLDFPHEGETVEGTVQVWGRAAAQGGVEFDRYVVEYGLSHDPQGWAGVVGPVNAPVAEISQLADWDTSALPNGPVTLRVVLFNRSGGSAEARIHLHLNNPPPTAAPTGTAAPTDAPTATAASTATLLPAVVESPSPSPGPLGATSSPGVTPTAPH